MLTRNQIDITTFTANFDFQANDEDKVNETNQSKRLLHFTFLYSLINDIYVVCHMKR